MKKIILLLGLAGVAFSGYLSSVRLFSQRCAFNESCPLFLGYPACYYGFVIFLIITIFAILLVARKMKEGNGLNAILMSSLLGIAFSSYFSLLDLPALQQNGFGFYKFGLPTCMLGFVFFFLVFIFSYIARFGKKESSQV